MAGARMCATRIGGAANDDARTGLPCEPGELVGEARLADTPGEPHATLEFAA